MVSDDLGAVTSTSNADGVPPMLLTEAAFRAREPQIRAITQLREGSFDVNAACTRLLGALPQIQAMRPRIEETFRKFNWEAFDDFEGRLHAAHYCNGLWLSKTENKVNLVGLAAEVDGWIEKMRETCEALIPFGKVAPAQLDGIGNPNGGYNGKVNDASRLLNILQRLGQATLSRTMFDPSDLSAVEVALLSFQRAMGKKQVVPVEREEASLLRQQAITYLLESFDEALNAAMYLYGDQAGKQLVPSPYADRGARKSKPESEPSQPSTAPVNDGPAQEAFVVANPTGLPLTNPFSEAGE